MLGSALNCGARVPSFVSYPSTDVTNGPPGGRFVLLGAKRVDA